MSARERFEAICKQAEGEGRLLTDDEVRTLDALLLECAEEAHEQAMPLAFVRGLLDMLMRRTA